MVKIAIVGGGIGGMALALALVDAGLNDVHVYESAPAIRELGVGINLLPHGVRELDELGLLGALLAEGVVTPVVAYYSKHGQHIWSESRGTEAGYRWSPVSIARGRLLGVLHRAVVDRLSSDRIPPATMLCGWDGTVAGHGASSSTALRGRPWVGSRPTWWWDATGCTPECAEHSIRTRGRRSGTGARCGEE